jgi:SAM-dependent methyltransferase
MKTAEQPRSSTVGHDYYEGYWSEGNPLPPGGGVWRPGLGELLPSLRELFDKHIPNGARCLDVGCGDGRCVGLWLHERGREYVGVDVSAAAIRRARSLGLDARQIDDATSLPFDNDTFDAVVCIEVLEHLFQPQVAASEIRRVLKPGGVLLATVPNIAYWRRRVDLALLGRWHPLGDSLSVQQPWRDPHIRFFNPGALRRMLIGSGFASTYVGGHEGTLIGDLPLIRRFRRLESRWLYQRLEGLVPSLFGAHLHAIARK